MKVRFIKNYKEYRQGEVYNVTPNELHGFIELGVAQADKMLDASQYKIVSKKKVQSATFARKKWQPS